MRPKPHHPLPPIHTSSLERGFQFAFVPTDVQARPARPVPLCASTGQRRPSFRRRIAFGTRSVLGLLGFGLVFLSATGAQAAVSITAGTGGTSLSADKAQNATAPAFTTLGNIVILEGANGDFATGTGVTLILTAPSGWRFNAGTGTATAAKISGSGGPEIAVNSFTVTATNMTVNMTVSAAAQINSLTISGIQVQATDGAVVPSSGDIFRATGNAGTATVSGITTTANVTGSGGSSFGSLSQTAGAIKKLGFATQPGSATAGAIFGVQPVVKTQDQFGNNSTSGLGASLLVTNTLSAGTGPLQGTTSFDIGTSAGNGTVTYTNLRIDAAGNGKQLTAAATGLTSGLSSTFAVSAAAAANFVVAGHPSPVTAGATNNFTVTARDAFGNTATGYTGTAHFTSSDGQAVLPANYTFTGGDAGVHTFGATLKTAGTRSITATDTVTSSITGAQTGIVVNAAGATTLTVSRFPSPVTAGAANTFTVTAKDAFGNTVAGYTGTVHFTSSDGQALLPANYTFTGGDAGAHTFSATLKTGGSQSITATDTVTSSITGSQSGINVNAAAAASLVVSGYASPTTAGVTNSFTVTAKDAFGNTAVGYTGTVHFTSTDGQAVLPANYTFVAGDFGVRSFSATLKTAGTRSITATDTVTSSITGTQSGIVVNAAAASSFIMSGYPSPTTAGAAQSFTVTAKDAFGHTANGYLGTAHLTSSDSQAVLPANYTFVAGDAGVHTFSATLKTAGTRSITATDTVTSSITGTQSGIVVNAAAANKLVIQTQPPATATAGVAFSPQPVIWVEDTFGNLVTTDNGRVITAARSAGTGTLQGTLTATTVNGVAAFSNLSHNLANTITLNFTATGLTAATSGSIVVSPAAFAKLQLLVPGETAAPATASGKTGTPTASTAATAFNITVNAVDNFWNVVNSITDTVDLSSTDANATLPADAALVSGTRTLSVTFKTAGSQTLTATDVTDGSKNANTSPSMTVNAGAFVKLQ